MQEYLEDSYRAQSNLSRIINDMKIIGVDEDLVEEGISERFRNKKQTDAIMEGEYRAPNFSEERFKTLIDRLEREDPIAAAKVESEIEEAIDIISDIRDEVDDEDLGLNPSFISDRVRELFEIPSVPTGGIISDQVAQKVNLPVDPNAATQPSPLVIAQTKKPITLTELEQSPIFSLLRQRGLA